MKKNISIILITLSIAASAQVPTNGLVSSYPFTGNSNDASGNGNNLTPFNGPTLTTDRFGNPNSAYLFDGINDYFTSPNPGPLLKKSRTIAFWAKTAANYNSQGYTVLYYGNPNSGGARFEVGLNSACNGLYLDLGYGFGSKPFTTIDNAWHFYTIVFDSTQTQGYFSTSYYVDASLISAFCYTYNPSQVINTQLIDPINIGRFTSSLPRYFNGCLDDIHVYNRPLTQSEINSIYSFVPLGVSQYQPSNQNVLVYPNPITNTIKINRCANFDQVELSNSLGQILIAKTILKNTEQLDVSQLMPGVYFITLKGGDATLTKKIIKE